MAKSAVVRKRKAVSVAQHRSARGLGKNQLQQIIDKLEVAANDAADAKKSLREHLVECKAGSQMTAVEIQQLNKRMDAADDHFKTFDEKNDRRHEKVDNRLFYIVVGVAGAVLLLLANLALLGKAVAG